jgi:hypothetical protein
MSSEDKHRLINFYTDVPAVKKILGDRKDEQVRLTGIPTRQHILFTGGTGSGKTTAAANLLALTGRVPKGTFTEIHLVRKTSEAIYEWLEESIPKHQLHVYSSLAELPAASSFSDQNGRRGKDHPKERLIWLDDCIQDRSAADHKKVMEYFTFGRKMGCSVWYLAQSYFDTPTFLRKNISWLILCGISGNRDLRLILKDHAFGNIDLDTITRMYQFAKQKRDPHEMNFMKIRCYEGDPKTKFSRNFLDHLDPANFGLEGPSEKAPATKTGKKIRRVRKESDSSSSDDNDDSSSDDDDDDEQHGGAILTIAEILKR